MKKTELARFFSVDQGTLDAAVASLRSALAGRGIALIETESELHLTTAPELGELIDAIRKDEMRRDIGKAGAETLAIILYRGPLSRSEIDFIRGVNSTFVLRNLLVRGLIERIDNPKDQRSYQYAATPSLLAHLGVTKKTELPEYGEIMTELEKYEREHAAADATVSATGEENGSSEDHG